MSETTTHGHKMTDGTIIPFKKLDIGDISPNHIDEMNKVSATLWDIVLLRNTIFDFKDEVKKDVCAQINELTKLIKNHESYCPANEDKVKELVQEELMSENVKKLMQKELMNVALKQVSKGSRIARYAWRAIIVIFLIINIYLFIIGKAVIQITP
ncbi:MAG: hypothetical protein RDU14_17920 [Melioribacteraceae bacterium]|nr:hypothetical protein [Melioribacteraceae bacterium]